MKTLSLKLDEDIYEVTEEMVKKIGLPRNRYINEALAFFNRYNQRKELAKAFKEASGLVKESSIKINSEFDQLIDETSI
ncbi:hypothetical protein [Algoriphagus sediminis]|uniref:CopG family transcriptional regulator n=1 Tax=Algoriphagus sediminis TaxID=3057113 RepID=A0ABT7YF78_9BACT|nr:hypothetical protein [Algoriphagus sediminis]MDN3205179.1 hypothetical protein [Algoriphagus sediminis]